MSAMQDFLVDTELLTNTNRRRRLALSLVAAGAGLCLFLLPVLWWHETRAAPLAKVESQCDESKGSDGRSEVRCMQDKGVVRKLPGVEFIVGFLGGLITTAGLGLLLLPRRVVPFSRRLESSTDWSWS